METIRFRVTDVSPLLMNSAAGLLDENKGLKAGKLSDQDQAERAAYRQEDGSLYLQTIALRGALIDGGKFSKIGRYSARTALFNSVYTLYDVCPLADPETGDPLTEYEIDRRPVVNPTTKGRIVAVRPKLPHWSCEVEFEFDPDRANAIQVEEAFNKGGKYVGVGDFRPARGGPFGRFWVKRIG